MNIYLLSLLLVVNTSLTRTPNFYPNYIAAKEASKNYKKDLLIFFSKNGCAECDAAWSNFEKDQVATKVYISTLIDAEDFDGIVIWDKYNFKSVPAWVVLSPDGQVKEKWAGDWRKTPTRPTTNTNDTISPVENKSAPAVPMPAPQATTSTPVSSQTPPVVQQAAAPSMTAAAAPEKVNTTPPATAPIPKTEAVAAGFVLQAGYFGSEPNAAKLVSDLKAKGFSGYNIMPTVQNGTTYYRVVSSSYASETEANNQVQTLASAGVKATVKKMSDLK